MSGGILGIGTSALLAYQQALATTGHNIANVNREGYSRQRVDFNNMTPQFAGNGYIGAGVKVDGITRIFDSFVQTQLQTSTSASNQYSVLHGYASRIDNLIADADAGLAPALQQFFAAVQDVANDPTSVSARQVLLSEAGALTDRLTFLQGRIDNQRAMLNNQISTEVDEINALAESIADMNERIVEAMGRAGGAPPNDLLDARDQLILQLSEKVSVTTVEQDDGAVNVFIGTGQSLVLGSQTTQLASLSLGADPDQRDIGMVLPSGSIINVSHLISGGSLGGLIDAGTRVLDSAQNMLGKVAVGLAEIFNAQHELGFDLDGNAGVAFFNAPQPQILFRQDTITATGTPTVSVSDVSGLTASDYDLRYNGTNWILRSLPDGAQVGVIAPGGTLTADGLTIDLSGVSGEANNDYFLIRPTHNAAKDISVAITDPRLIAAGGGNGPGDNTNALELAALRDSKIMDNGTASILGTYSSLVADVGVKTRSAEVSMQAQERLLADARATREMISGVNLDEEAANLIRFQQAYQASAQVIGVTRVLFDTLLTAVR